MSSELDAVSKEPTRTYSATFAWSAMSLLRVEDVGRCRFRIVSDPNRSLDGSRWMLGELKPCADLLICCMALYRASASWS
jgi:hypothetical protein